MRGLFCVFLPHGLAVSCTYSQISPTFSPSRLSGFVCLIPNSYFRIPVSSFLPFVYPPRAWYNASAGKMPVVTNFAFLLKKKAFVLVTGITVNLPVLWRFK